MADFVTNITIDDVIDALIAFTQPFVGSAEIVRAQVNRVPMPLDPCVVLTEIMQVDLERPYSTFDSQIEKQIMHGPSRIDVQMDFYGPLAGEQCRAIQTAFRTGYASTAFPESIKPLYTSDGIQSPLITGEQQWESRWTLTASMQYNSIITVPQQFADILTVALIEGADNQN